MKAFRFFTLVLAFAAAAQLSAQSANIQTVQANYAAFGQGNIPAILATLTDDCVWMHAGNPALVPFAGTFRGKAEIGAKFFAAIPASVEITVFEPRAFQEAGNTVTATVHIRGRVLSTGKEFENVAEMIWTFNPAGQVTVYDNRFDPVSLETAFTK